MTTVETLTTNLPCQLNQMPRRLGRIILPKCYKDLLAEEDILEETNEVSNLPSYDELLGMLDLKGVCASTVWQWLQLMGYKYNENRRCYYTDGHERENVVKDRNKRFLTQYFKLER
jgi:hypothetical protein